MHSTKMKYALDAQRAVMQLCTMHTVTLTETFKFDCTIKILILNEHNSSILYSLLEICTQMELLLKKKTNSSSMGK